MGQSGQSGQTSHVKLENLASVKDAKGKTIKIQQNLDIRKSSILMVRCKLCKQFDVVGGYPSSYAKAMALNRDFRAYFNSNFKMVRDTIRWYIKHLQNSHEMQDKMIVDIYDHYEIIPLELCGDSSAHSLKI